MLFMTIRNIVYLKLSFKLLEQLNLISEKEDNNDLIQRKNEEKICLKLKMNKNFIFLIKRTLNYY